MVTCKNCSNEFEGKFCPKCGQKANVRRIETRDLFTDLLKKLLPWDKGFLYTTRRLLGSPGQMVREFVEGKRVDYTKPLNYLFLVTATSLLVFNKDLFLKGMHQSGQTIPETQYAQQLLTWIFSHMALLMTGLIPFLAVASKTFFRKSGENYAEHLVFNVYVMSGCIIVNTPTLLVYYVTGVSKPHPMIAMLGTLPYLAFFVWGYLQFFRPRSPFLGVFKSLLVYAAGYMLYILFISLVIAAGIFFYVKILGQQL